MPKFVIISGRSSHTITANSKEEAIKKFNKGFPYAEPRYIFELKEKDRLKQIRNR